MNNTKNTPDRQDQINQQQNQQQKTRHDQESKKQGQNPSKLQTDLISREHESPELRLSR